MFDGERVLIGLQFKLRRTVVKGDDSAVRYTKGRRVGSVERWKARITAKVTDPRIRVTATPDEERNRREKPKSRQGRKAPNRSQERI